MILMTALLAAALAATPGEDLPIDASWALDRGWDDGLAEVAHYDARRMVYGTERSFETVLITVKEDHDRRLGVKAEPPLAGRDLVPVLKLNMISRIQTENYPYDYMTSLFVKRDDPRVVTKLAQSSQEWCGTTFKEVVAWDGEPYLAYHSYFDEQADGRQALPLGPGVYLEEQLFLTTRAARLEPGIDYRISLYDSLVTNGARAPVLRQALVSLAGREEVSTPAGTFASLRIEIREAAAPRPLMTFWIEEAGARALLRFEAADGRGMRLSRIQRRNYWSRPRRAP